MKLPQWCSGAAGTVVAGTILVFAASAATHLVSALPPFHPVVWDMPAGDRCYAFAGRLSCFEPETTKKAVAAPSCE